MGFGDLPFGDGPFGYDGPANVSARPTPTDPLPFYDPYDRTYPFKADGSELLSVHPVMTSAALALGVTLGAVPAVPGLGYNTKRVRNAREEDVPAVHDDEARIAVAHLTKAGVLEVVRTRASVSPSGAVEAEVSLRNLLDPTSEVVSIPIRF